MSDPQTHQDSPDPREAMREALERKKQHHHGSPAAGPTKGSSVPGGPHGQAGGKRTFRRKSGS
ncbi:DUF5302 domain-containing protein [Propionibacteriaceae bacterium Y1923]|uniref:DUF5302 domain-containing protein n=1 Tax=Aestuariimicrobium sp. Y1814 TaxID=3418742 RepID=UPI003C16348E